MLKEIENTELERLLERRAELLRSIEFEYEEHGATSLRGLLEQVTEEIGSQLEQVRLTSDTELAALLDDIKQVPVNIPTADLAAWVGKYDNVEAIRQEWWIALMEHGTS